jgi:putative nucleotidyltransferase with HDIG domain
LRIDPFIVPIITTNECEYAGGVDGMKGFYINKMDAFPDELRFWHDGLKLLAKRGNLEVMQQNIVKGAIVWLVPSGNEEDIEFFFVHAGAIEMIGDDFEEKFYPGDSFYANGLKDELFFRTLEDTTLLYMSTTPVFDNEAIFQMDLARMVSQINRKDDYTFRHSRNVMHYSLKLYTNLKEFCEIDKTDDILVAALFHDIGKCRIADDILKKKGRLEPHEYEKMKLHTVYGAELLSQYYPKSITDLALNHHERLDGSGYPNGLRGDEISFGARILAVADSFDAITTNRGYNSVRGFRAAAEELLSMPEAYDSRVTQMLLSLVDSGEITWDSLDEPSEERT